MGTAPGRTKYIETPEKLWELFVDFMSWVEKNPFRIMDFVGKDGDMVHREKQRPITFVGFEKWLSLNEVVSDLSSYEKNEGNRYADYVPIITRIKKVCKGDIVEGAASGIFNANIAARVASLAEKSESEVIINRASVEILRGEVPLASDESQIAV